MADEIVLIPGKPGHRIKIDVNAFGALFASFEKTAADALNDALRDEAKRVMHEAYAREPMHVPDTLDALPMRKNADGVFVLDKRANTYVTEDDAAAYQTRYGHGTFVKVKPPKKYK